MTDPWGEALRPARWLESLLAMAAAVVVARPLGDLVSSQPWTLPLVGTLLLVVVVGSAVRMARVPRWVVLLAQVVALLSALSWWVRAPRPDGESAVAAAHTLLVEGIDTIQSYAVPAPATPGLTFIVLTGMALLALLVESLAVTFRAAAVAGVPLLLVSAATASSSGQALDPRYFLLAGAAWLVLLARQHRSVLEEWRAAGAPSTAATSYRAAATRGSERRLGFVARVMGLAALVLAVALPGLLPHLPPTTLLAGGGGDGASGTVSFTETLDLAQDLADRSTAPVIRYRTDDSSPPPLRVTVSTDYEDGSWQPAPHDVRAPITQEEIMTLNSILLEHSGMDVTPSTTTVTQNGMRAPQLALPHPTTAADLGEIEWEWDPMADVALVDSAPRSYDATYLEIPPLTTLPEGLGVPARLLLDEEPVEDTQQAEDGTIERYGRDGRLLERVDADGRRERPMTDGTVQVVEADGTVRRGLAEVDSTDPLAVDAASADRVRGLAEEVAGDATNQVDVAMAIQRYLRGPEFAYSLTLADPVEGPDGAPLDPISHFLETKQGYCTQFATAMVMMARVHDIPARLAVGFLPGSQGLDGTYTVVAADAHAWPELFVNGLGWTRFEPTPGTRSGAAPYFATAGQDAQLPTAAPDPTVAPPTAQPVVPDPQGGEGGGAGPGWYARHAELLGTVALALAVAAVAASVVPLAGWWRRDGWRSRRGLGPAARIESEWSVLTASLADLGVRPPPTATPRGLREHYAREIDPDPPTSDALARAADRLESSRYAAQAPRVGTMREDVRRVVEWCREHAPRRRRLRAALLPASGLAQLRSLLPGDRRHEDLAPAPRP